MIAKRSFVLVAIVGCGSPDAPVAPATGSEPDLQVVQSGDRIALTGSGHHIRTNASGEELTTFAFTAVEHADGSVTGQYQYHFRLSGFSVHGPVTCVSVSGNQAWVGGTVDRIVGGDPSLQDLVGVDMWWRSKDLGEGAGSEPDSTTGLGFKFPTTAITAESWCRDQPVALAIRPILGNVQLHTE